MFFLVANKKLKTRVYVICYVNYSSYVLFFYNVVVGCCVSCVCVQNTHTLFFLNKKVTPMKYEVEVMCV